MSFAFLACAPSPDVTEKSKVNRDRRPLFILAREQKAPELRAIASRLGLKFTENQVAEPRNAIEFAFELTYEELNSLLSEVPHDIHARRGMFVDDSAP